MFLYLTTTTATATATATVKCLNSGHSPGQIFNLSSLFLGITLESTYSSLPLLYFCVIFIYAKQEFKFHAKEVGLSYSHS